MSFHFVGLGEVLWDLLPSGPQLGGAPANFACHAAALGARASVISRVGSDSLGTEAVRSLQERGLDLRGLETDPTLPTGVVTVTLAADGHPEFAIAASSAWDALGSTAASMEVASGADALCFGSLAQRTQEGFAAVQRLVRSTRSSALRVFDINLRAPFFAEEQIVQSLDAANVLKLNETELPILADMLGLTGSAEAQLESIARRYSLSVVAQTLGAAGSRVWRNGAWSMEPGHSVVLRDAVGAGDSFTAALVLGLLQGWETAPLLAAATDVAAFVCTESGATPRLPAGLTGRFRRE